MTASGISGDFTVVDTAMLNRYFREYFLDHGQGGTHTQQRNLIQLFSYLERERGAPSPYKDGLNGTRPSKGGPRRWTRGSSTNCSRSQGAGGPGTSRRPATTR